MYSSIVVVQSYFLLFIARGIFCSFMRFLFDCILLHCAIAIYFGMQVHCVHSAVFIFTF